MDTVQGSVVVPMAHRDYLSDVPAYRYELVCGHRTFYRVPVAHMQYGYCRECRSYWRKTANVREIPPRGRVRALGADEIDRRVDEAVMKNRVADLVISRNGYDSAAAIATMAGCSERLVYNVQRDLGLAPTPTTEEERNAA